MSLRDLITQQRAEIERLRTALRNLYWVCHDMDDMPSDEKFESEYESAMKAAEAALVWGVE